MHKKSLAILLIAALIFHSVNLFAFNTTNTQEELTFQSVNDALEYLFIQDQNIHTDTARVSVRMSDPVFQIGTEHVFPDGVIRILPDGRAELTSDTGAQGGSVGSTGGMTFTINTVPGGEDWIYNGAPAVGLMLSFHKVPLKEWLDIGLRHPPIGNIGVGFFNPVHGYDKSSTDPIYFITEGGLLLKNPSNLHIVEHNLTPHPRNLEPLTHNHLFATDFLKVVIGNPINKNVYNGVSHRGTAAGYSGIEHIWRNEIGNVDHDIGIYENNIDPNPGEAIMKRFSEYFGKRFEWTCDVLGCPENGMKQNCIRTDSRRNMCRITLSNGSCAFNSMKFDTEGNTLKDVLLNPNLTTTDELNKQSDLSKQILAGAMTILQSIYESVMGENLIPHSRLIEPQDLFNWYTNPHFNLDDGSLLDPNAYAYLLILEPITSAFRGTAGGFSITLSNGYHIAINPYQYVITTPLALLQNVLRRQPYSNNGIHNYPSQRRVPLGSFPEYTESPHDALTTHPHKNLFHELNQHLQPNGGWTLRDWPISANLYVETGGKLLPAGSTEAMQLFSRHLNQLFQSDINWGGLQHSSETVDSAHFPENMALNGYGPPLERLAFATNYWGSKYINPIFTGYNPIAGHSNR